MRRLPFSPSIALVIATSVALAAVAVGATVLRPTGTADAREAVRRHLRADAAPGSVDILVSREWGGGRMILSGFQDTQDRPRVAISFAIDHGRGWRVAASTATAVSPTDVRVGSLVVSTGPGGKDQPPWSAAYGRTSRPDIASVEVEWTSGSPTSAPVEGDAYLVIRQGLNQVTAVRYLAEGGAEIAKVPVG